MMLWNPLQNSDDENLKWCLLRAIEWNDWPLFLSQPVAPLIFVVLPWPVVVISVLALNYLWAFLIREDTLALMPHFSGRCSSALNGSYAHWPRTASTPEGNPFWL